MNARFAMDCEVPETARSTIASFSPGDRPLQALVLRLASSPTSREGAVDLPELRKSCAKHLPTECPRSAVAIQRTAQLMSLGSPSAGALQRSRHFHDSATRHVDPSRNEADERTNASSRTAAGNTSQAGVKQPRTRGRDSANPFFSLGTFFRLCASRECLSRRTPCGSPAPPGCDLIRRPPAKAIASLQAAAALHLDSASGRCSR